MHRTALLAGVLAIAVAGCGGSAHHASGPGPATTPGATRAHQRHRGLQPLPPAPRRPASGPQRVAVPILMYHVVSTPPPGVPNAALWVSTRLFFEQMHALRAAGYHAVTMAQVWDGWTGRHALVSKPVVVSFDDGYLSQYTHAARVLRAMRWPGVLNLKVGDIGPGGLTKHMVRAMIAAGWEVDAHTITHPDLTTVDAARLRSEVSGSRAILRRDFGVPVAFFCYPSGRFDATVESAVKRAGYLAATTTQPGLAAPGGDPNALPRVRVNGGETAAQLMATLRASQVTHPVPGAAASGA